MFGIVAPVAYPLFVESDNVAGIFVDAPDGSIAAHIVDDIVPAVVHGRLGISSGTAPISVHLSVRVPAAAVAAPSVLCSLAGTAAVASRAASPTGSAAGIVPTAREGLPDS